MKCKRDGYTFTGWTNADGRLLITSGGKVYDEIFPWNVDGVELYARWAVLDPFSE